MFKEQMYRDLREDLELFEMKRWSKQKGVLNQPREEAILCKFLRREKEADIGLLIRRHRLALASLRQTEGREEYFLRENQYRDDVLEYLKRNPKLLKSSEEKAIFERLSKNRDAETLFLTEKLAEIILSFSDSKGRKNAYIVVREAYLDYQTGKLSIQQLLDKLREVYHRQYVVHEVCKKVLKSDRSASDGGLRGIRPDLLVEELLTAILVLQAKAVLYDAGFPYEHQERNKDAQDEEAVLHIDYKDSNRRRDSALDLADLYMEKKGNLSYKDGSEVNRGQEGGKFDEDFKRHCIKTYQVLQREKREDICLPLYMENKTGSGIYIVGRNLLDPVERKKAERELAKEGKIDSNGQYCHFCYLYNLELLDGGGDSGFSILLSTEHMCGNDIDYAIRAFQDARIDKYGAYKEQNGVFPEGLDEKYRVYFQKAELYSDNGSRKEELSVEQYKAEREKDPLYQKMLQKRKI